MMVETEARNSDKRQPRPAARWGCAILRPDAASVAILLALAACASPATQVVPAMAPAAAPECEVEWPADPSAPPFLACSDGSSRTIESGPALIVGDPALAQAIP
jgi:hypothetical protein